MNLLTIPLRNMRRKPAKTLLLLAAFALGVSSIVALYQVSRVVGHNLEKKLSAYGANIVIKPSTRSLSVSYGGFSMGDMLLDVQEMGEQPTIDTITSIALRDRISIVAPKLIAMQKIDDVAVGVVGVRWQPELSLKSYWAVDGAFPESKEQILLGSRAAEMLDAHPGGTLSLFGKSYAVSGVLYETGGDDDAVILMDLGQLQEVTGQTDAISFVEIAALCSGCPIQDIVGQLQKALPATSVIALQNVVNQRMSSIRFVQKLALIVSVVILVTASAMVGLSMLSSVVERRKDIGILRSLGYGKSKVFVIFCIEAGIIGGAAGLIGYLVGFGASIKILDLLTLADGARPAFSSGQLALCTVVFPLIAVISTLYPAWKGAKVEPSQALVSI